MASISFTCPNCAKILRTSTRPTEGKKVRCPACSEAFVPELEAELAATRIQEKPSARPKLKSRKTDDELDPEPKRKRRRDEEDDDRDEDEDDRPIKKKKKSKPVQKSNRTLVLALSIGAGLIGVFSCILLGVGAFVWPGFLKPTKTYDLAAFVPADANLVMGGNPKLMKSKFPKLGEMAMGQGPFGAVNPQQLEDVTFNSERMLAFGNTKDFMGGVVIVYQSNAADIAKLKRNPAMGPAMTVGGHDNVHRQGMQAKANGLQAFMAFPGGNVVVSSELSEKDLLAALDRAKQGGQPNAVMELGRSVDSAPFWLAMAPDANTLAQMKQSLEQGGAQAPQGLRDAAPALAGIKGMTITLDVTETQDLKINAKLQCKNAEDAAKLKTGIEEGFGMFRTGLQFAAGFQMPGQPQMPPSLTADLNAVTFEAKGDTVTGAMKISQQTIDGFAKLAPAVGMFPGMGPQIGPGPMPKIGPGPKVGPGPIPINPNKGGFPQRVFGPPKDVTPEGPAKQLTKLEPGKDTTFTVNNLKMNEYQERKYTFEKGKLVTIRMTSVVDQPNTDIDLYLYQGDIGQLFVASDISIGPNGLINFQVPVTGTYRVRVINVDGNGGTATSSTVTITAK